MSNSGGSSVPRIQVFRPTMEEFKNFSKYIEKIESEGAHKAGLAKIIPPDGWTPRKRGYDDIELVIPAPISQVVTGRQGLYQQINIQQKAMTVKEFQKLADGNKYKTPPHFDYEDLERKYWKNITYNSPIYGADVSGSLYDNGVEEFNIQHLNTILDMVKEDYEIQIEGVNTAYLYFGMWKTTFAWHTEDMDLYSINYLHFGAPKSWYVVPPEHGRRLERLAAGFFHGSYQSCPAFLRHKMTIISPHILKQYSIPYQKITQEPGEFMITFPFGYHSGFNHGFNCAESTNFALPRWIEYGKRTISCTCRNDCVKICMDMFVRKYQPDIYELWKAGKNFGSHPEDPSRHYAAPAPRKLELRLSEQREERKRAKEIQGSQKIKRHPISKVEKCEQKKDSRKSSKVHPRESDEETELYDVNEVITCKNPKKQLKKECNEEKTEFEEVIVGIEPPVEHTVEAEIVQDIKKESETEESDMEEDSEEDMKDEVKVEVEDPNRRVETDAENPQLKLYSDNPEKEQIIDYNSSTEDYEDPKKLMDDPPELKPFWDPEVKIKSPQNNNAPKTNANERSSFETHMEVLNRYPHLMQAIDSGTFSVVPVNPKEEKYTPSTAKERLVESFQVGKRNSEASDINYNNKDLTTFSLPNTLLSHTWRCEQTNKGLKLKIVQPKIVRQNAIEPVCKASSSPKDDMASLTSENSAQNLEEIHTKQDEDHNNEPKKISQTKGGLRKRVKSKKSPGEGSHRRHASQKNDTSSNGSQVSPGSSKVQRADNSQESWAHPIKDLWQHRPQDFEAEIMFNERLASITPHCAICVIFTPMYNRSHFPSESSRVPEVSPVRMPAFCYGNSLYNECLLDTNSLLRPDGTAPLLICRDCKVCVHATCYGMTMLPAGNFVCTRCTRQAHDAECCLCVLRGGALQPTTDNRWAHITCAILIAEVYFEDTFHKQPINISKITPVRQRLKCKYCVKTAIPKDSKGVCVQCQCGRCYLPYHVTCGYMAGVIFETSDWPEPIRMICTRHATARKKPPKRELTSVSVWERVIAKHKNKRYYWANVKKKYIQEYYSILFEDNSHSTNTLPEDIVNINVAVQGPPKINEKVQVKWTDDKIYNGTFKGSQSSELYVIEFDDGSVLHQERKQIYGADEELPKEVQSKMSHSSESRNMDFVAETNGKRIRISNHKYS